MIGRIEVVCEGERTFPMAVERMVTRGRHYPFVPPHVTEVHVQGMSLAAGLVLVLPALFADRCLTFLPCVEHGVPSAVVAVSHQQGPSLRPRVLVLVQGPAHPDMPTVSLGMLPVHLPLLGVKHFYHKAMVVTFTRSPLRHSRADIKALPPAQRVLHEPSVQKTNQRFPTASYRQPKYLINVDAVEATCRSAASSAAVTGAVVGRHSSHDLIPEDPQLGRGDELLLRDRSKVEVELLGRFAFQAGEGLHGLCKDETNLE